MRSLQVREGTDEERGPRALRYTRTFFSNRYDCTREVRSLLRAQPPQSMTELRGELPKHWMQLDIEIQLASASAHITDVEGKTRTFIRIRSTPPGLTRHKAESTSERSSE